MLADLERTIGFVEGCIVGALWMAMIFGACIYMKRRLHDRTGKD